jgi:hypothetical protein
MLKAGCAPCARTRRGAQAGHRQAELRKYRDQLTSSAGPEPQVASHELLDLTGRTAIVTGASTG